MIVHSIRLKNIKSYAEGPQGTGVTVFFEPGINRVAGKNGHGKTTLIESLGYALFLKEPILEERVLLETYFLRAGTKAAEIDVTFSHDDELLRVERGLGPNNRRLTKVVQVENGSTCAEGEREVSAFICRLFQLPGPDRVSELFWKLIGVRQGRLTWPFDSTPGDAKKFFEPLLDVAVFRQCFDSLKPAVGILEERVHEQEKIRAAVEERIRERSDSGTKLEEKLQQLKETEQRLRALNETRDAAFEALLKLEQAQTAHRAAELRRNAARESAAFASQMRAETEKLLRESLEAVLIVEKAALGFQSFEDAEKELLVLRTKQIELHRLHFEISNAEGKKTETDGKSDSAISQAQVFATQREAKISAQKDAFSTAEALRVRLSESQLEFDRRNNFANRATRSISDIRHFVNALTVLMADGREVLKVLEEYRKAASKDPAALETARVSEESASAKLELLGRQLAAAEAEHGTLAAQLQQIGGGICPFLKEQCRQFDPAKVEGDLKEKSAIVESLRAAKKESEVALRAAHRSHEKRRAEESEFAARKSRVEQCVFSFLSAFDRLPWAETSEKVAELRLWIGSLEGMPDRLVSAEARADIETFEVIFSKNASFADAVSIWWNRSERGIQHEIDRVFEDDRRRAAEQRDEVNHRDRIQQLESEIGVLNTEEERQRKAAMDFRKISGELETAIAVLNERRQALASVPDKISSLELALENSRGDYQLYLGSKASANQQVRREKEVADQKEREQQLVLELARSESHFLALDKDFDGEALMVARRNSEQAGAAAATETVHLANARRELEREEERNREWKLACAKRDEIDREILRLQNAIRLTELARHVLRDSAPIVAQHLCDRIASRAQRIFNRINHEPAELKWEAVPRYSLRAIPGDRRFAMLSGGEQTKLALSMTLAMIQEFSGLRFCVFDEPTYGVDAESRDKLGDALLESQRAAGLEQLILVSHDDSFDGKIEHTILLRKSARDGTEVV